MGWDVSLSPETMAVLAVADTLGIDIGETLEEMNPEWGKVKYDHYKLGAPWEDPITGVDYLTTSRRKKDWKGEWVYEGDQKIKSTGNYLGGKGGWDLDLGSGSPGAQKVRDLYTEIKSSIPERKSKLSIASQNLPGGEKLDPDSYASMTNWLSDAESTGFDIRGSAQRIKDELLSDKGYKVPEAEIPTVAKFSQLGEALVPGSDTKDAVQFMLANENLDLLDTLKSRVKDFEVGRKRKLRDFNVGAKKSGIGVQSDIIDRLAQDEFRSGFAERDIQSIKDAYASNIGIAREKFLDSSSTDWESNIYDVLSGFADEYADTVSL